MQMHNAFTGCGRWKHDDAYKRLIVVSAAPRYLNRFGSPCSRRRLCLSQTFAMSAPADDSGAAFLAPTATGAAEAAPSATSDVSSAAAVASSSAVAAPAGSVETKQREESEGKEKEKEECAPGRGKKQKMALLLVYNGGNYCGMQVRIPFPPRPGNLYRFAVHVYLLPTP